VRAERALEELGDAIHHDLLWMRTEDSGPNRARIALCRTAASMRKVVRGLEGRLLELSFEADAEEELAWADEEEDEEEKKKNGRGEEEDPFKIEVVW
jgi:hypothetical protein